MSRPTKRTVDYFPHDAKASSGKTLTILEDRYKNNGYAFWFKLLEILADSPGHFYDCRNPFNWEFLQSKTHCDEQTTRQILELLVKLEAIDSILWKEYQVIWSDNFVFRLVDVYTNRRTELPIKPSFNGDKPSADYVSTPDNNSANGQSTGDNHISTQTTPHSKVKESKVKESKEKKSTISFEDYISQELTPEFPDLNITEELKRFNLYWSEGNRKLKRPKLAFRNWLTNSRKYKVERGQGNGTHSGNNQASGNGHGNSEQDSLDPTKSKYTTGKYGQFVQH